MTINTCFGVFIAIALTFIGVPNSVLWGILAGVMRFVPFIGSLISAFFPVALAAAADPGWTMPFSTAAVFAVAQPVQAQVVEPLVYGRGTGLSPVAVVLSTLFWTLLWGPVGLLLATPMTVCLVVLGKHIEGLNFIDVLLGNEPPLLPEERFYQRLLAEDATEAADQAEARLTSMSLSSYFDDVAMKALVLAQADAADGKLSNERQTTICNTMHDILEDLDDYEGAEPPDASIGTADEGQRDAAIVGPPMGRALCVASRSPIDEAAAAMLAQILQKQGVPALLLPFASATAGNQNLVEAGDAKLVCLSYFGLASKPAHVRYLIRRLRRRMPQAQFLACFWLLADDSGKVEEWRTAVGADYAASSLTEAADVARRVLVRTARPALTCVSTRQAPVSVASGRDA
jgi:hypothetical protein